MYQVRYVRPLDTRLGRHVRHDPLSRRFPVRSDAPIASVQHERHVSVWNQGRLGSCTGNAGLGCLGTGPFHATMSQLDQAVYPFTEDGAVALYGDATEVDDYRGAYPPDDTGSDGLSIAKVLTGHGMIAGYRHAFGIDDLLRGLQDTPCIVGTDWTDGMFDPDARGVVHPRGVSAGGHEYVCDGYDAENTLVWFTNSWGTGWGVGGRFAMPRDEFAWLLSRDGDATFFVPATEPQPSPEPIDDPQAPGQTADGADRALWGEVAEWARKTDTGSANRIRRELRTWAWKKGMR